MVDRVTAAHEKLEFGETGRAFYDFFWSQFADWYIESAKTRLYSDDAQAAHTTRAVHTVFSHESLNSMFCLPHESEGTRFARMHACHPIDV